MKVTEVTNVFMKPARGVPMVEATHLSVQPGMGIHGDINAHPMSPRQILFVRQEDLQRFSIEPGGLRENVVMRGIEPAHFVPGTVLQIDEVRVRLTFACESCKRIAHVVDPQAIADYRGILGVILSAGDIHVGASVRPHLNVFEPLSPIPLRRFQTFIKKIPAGRVITYREVVVGMGVAESYFRAIPMYIQRSSPQDFPVHRIVDSEGKLITHVPNQQTLLEREGVRFLQPPQSTLFDFEPIQLPTVDLSQCLWHDAHVYR